MGKYSLFLIMKDNIKRKFFALQKGGEISMTIEGQNLNNEDSGLTKLNKKLKNEIELLKVTILNQNYLIENLKLKIKESNKEFKKDDAPNGKDNDIFSLDLENDDSLALGADNDEIIDIVN